MNLKARGKGNTAYTEEDIRIIDFGTIYTNRNITKRYFIENRG